MTTEQGQYYRWVTLAGIASSTTAGLLIIGKLTAWLLTGSSSLLASLTDSMMDISASLISLMAVRYALIPADNNHQFGHGKAESLASLAQAAFITGSAVVLLMHGLDALVDPKPLQHIGIGIWISVASLALTIVLVSFQSYVIKLTGSQAVKADSLHYRSDVLLNSAVLLALVLSSQGFSNADAIFAILLGGYILWSALQIGYDAIQTLLDRQLPDEECQQISDICCAVEGVRGIHDLKTRISGPMRFIQLHLELDDDLPLVKAHELADLAEMQLKEHFPISDILIHMDPISVLPKEHVNHKP
ncbi:cation diffusion facilitator family transporter [uncultured Tolumonas sp.]|uniref:cation efflux pump FieF n=1 Tax=uncultured Tolumonas sp. TaxID=263765 RepID=UPI00292F36B0|nr:cation diffusion facilitator family transporter [uncultured Tolumonas sp.]